MKVSLTWLGVVLLLVVILTFTYNGFCILYDCYNETEEGFTTSSSSQGISLVSCPSVQDGLFPELEKQIDQNGNTVCKMKTTQTAVCTLSQGGSLPSCANYLLSHYQSRADSFCPPSLPNYYESKDGKGTRVRGCFAGSYNQQGTGPQSNSVRTCRVYDTKKQDELALDSCTNIKMLDNAKCIPGTVATKRLNTWNSRIPPHVWCDYNNPVTGMPRSCAEDASAFAQHEYAVKIGLLPSNWMDTYESYNKINWCAKQKMVEIDKSITFDDLKYISIDPKATGPVYPSLRLEDMKNKSIQNKASKLCLDVWGNGQNDGAKVIPWDCHGGPNQKLTLDSKERLVFAHSGKCLDLSPQTGRLQQYTCHEAKNQKWYADSMGRIHSRQNNLCLKTVNAKGSDITVAFCGDGDDQKFVIA